MRRIVPAALVALAVAASPSSPATAQDRPEQLELEALVAELEALIDLLDGDVGRPPVVTRHDDGLTSIVFPLDRIESIRDDRTGRRGARAARDFQTLAVGHSKPAPRRTEKLITAPHSNRNTRYHYWWCLANFSNNVRTATTILKLKGPGNGFNQTGPVDYPNNALVCFFLRPTEGVGTAGVYTWQAKVQGGGLAKEKFLAQ